MVLQVSDKSFLHSLFDKAEKQKSAFNIPEIEEQRREICENFAMDVFFNADNEDRSGNFTQETAKAFYAASLFFDVLARLSHPVQYITRIISYIGLFFRVTY